jgi:hypothetical protein
MLNLPDNYLQTYRDRVQEVTIDDIRRVAENYVKPDEAALIVVGDGAQVLDQIRPYCENIETYDTAGKRKQPAVGRSVSGAADVSGAWALEIETPLGQNIPAKLVITRDGGELKATINSEMGNADLGTIDLKDNAFQTTASTKMDGRSVNLAISARFEGDRTEGSLSLQSFPPMPFLGSKTD